jgi:hypothetical protein
MLRTEIKADDSFTHIETGAVCVVDCVGKMKQEGGTWYDAVTYHRIDAPEAKFTRAAAAFKLHFAE